MVAHTYRLPLSSCNHLTSLLRRDRKDATRFAFNACKNAFHLPERCSMGKSNDRILFWASFLTLIAAGMGASIRGDILNDWGQSFGFTQTELGKISGMGLMGFGVTILFFSFFADVVGYGKLMVVAFLLHAAAVLITLAAPFVF